MAKKGERGTPGGTGGARPGAGRPPGLSKAKLEQLAIAERDIKGARDSGKKLAKEVLDEFMHLFAGMAAYYQPTPPDAAQQNRNGDDVKFEKFAVLAVDTARMLAPYQSPTFKAIQVFTSPDRGDAPPMQKSEGNLLVIDNPEAAQRLYKRMITQVR